MYYKIQENSIRGGIQLDLTTSQMIIPCPRFVLPHEHLLIDLHNVKISSSNLSYGPKALWYIDIIFMQILCQILKVKWMDNIVTPDINENLIIAKDMHYHYIEETINLKKKPILWKRTYPKNQLVNRFILNSKLTIKNQETSEHTLTRMSWKLWRPFSENDTKFSSIPFK